MRDALRAKEAVHHARACLLLGPAAVVLHKLFF
jgi:hypothetical protein